MQVQKEYKLTNTKRFDLKKIEQIERQVKQTKDLKNELKKRKKNQANVLALAEKTLNGQKIW